MTKRKTLSKLESFMDALNDSLDVVAHNRVEKELIQDKLIKYQLQYKKICGNYYKFSEKK